MPTLCCFKLEFPNFMLCHYASTGGGGHCEQGGNDSRRAHRRGNNSVKGKMNQDALHMVEILKPLAF
jgi:hypothetical protein